MRAFTLDSFGTAPGLRTDIPMPELGTTELLVRIHASSVNPVDAFTAMGALDGMIAHHFPVVLGRDLAGVVEQVGPAVSRYAVGDEVFGWLNKPVLEEGTFADYIALPEYQFVARKPATVDFVHAAAAPLAASTALFALQALSPGEGDTVLVVGATGGVGSMFVQLAAGRGAHVIATALPEDESFALGLGAAETVDRGEDVPAVVRERHPGGVAALLDLVSHEPSAFQANAGSVKPGGRAVSTLSAAREGGTGDVVSDNITAASDPAMLRRLAELIDAGSLRVPVQRIYPLDQVGRALADLRGLHTQGKLAISIA